MCLSIIQFQNIVYFFYFKILKLLLLHRFLQVRETKFVDDFLTYVNNEPLSMRHFYLRWNGH